MSIESYFPNGGDIQYELSKKINNHIYEDRMRASMKDAEHACVTYWVPSILMF